MSINENTFPNYVGDPPPSTPVTWPFTEGAKLIKSADEELRRWCVERAMDIEPDGVDPLPLASKIFAFVRRGEETHVG